jgi:Small-conductance mechanosensitive channel
MSENIISLISNNSEKILKILFILLASFLANKLVKRLSKRVKKTIARMPISNAKQQQRLNTIRGLIVTTSQVAISLIAMLMILPLLGIDIAPLLAGAGVAGLAIGLGLRSFVSDVVSGFFILWENQFNVGDKVKIANQEGIVKKITLRTVFLKGTDGSTIIIPNSNISVVIKYRPKKTK